MLQLRRPLHLLALLGGVLALTLAVAACGGGGNSDGVASVGGKATATTSPGGSSDPQQAALAYARCMRQHGVNLPDPQVSGDDIDLGLPRGVNRDDPRVRAAEQVCRTYLPDGGPTVDPPTPQMLQQTLAFARCMRQHSINIPDPKPGSGIDARGANPNGPKFNAAQRACQPLLPNAGNKQTQSNGGGR
jgi:hypothetical protein